MTTDSSENLLEPKSNRSPAEVGREVIRLVREHGTVCVSEADDEWDVKIFLPEED